MKLKKRIGQIWTRFKVRGHLIWQAGARLLQPVAGFASAHMFLLQIILVIVYRLSLDLLYIKGISPIYAYEHFTLDIQPFYYGCTLLMVIALSPFIVQLQGTAMPSAKIVTFLNYIYFIPFTTYCGCYSASTVFFLFGILYWLFLLVFQFRLPVLYLALPKKKNVQKFFLILTVFSAAFIMFISWRYTGFRLTLDFINVYDIRTEAGSYNMPRIFSYVLSMMTVTLSFSLLYWLTRKKYIVTALLVVVYMFLFSIGALKSQFFFLFLLLGCFFLYRPWMLRWLGGFLSLLAAASLGVYKLTGMTKPIQLVFRRSMFLVVQLGEQYMNFFQNNPISVYRDGILNKFPKISSIYAIKIPRIIGEFRGHIDESANNGLLGDMFANFPALFGIVLLPLILVICFRLLDAAAHNHSEKLLISICFLYAFYFANSSWSTVLLTHGFLLACLLFYFFPKEEKLIS